MKTLAELFAESGIELRLGGNGKIRARHCKGKALREADLAWLAQNREHVLRRLRQEGDFDDLQKRRNLAQARGVARGGMTKYDTQGILPAAGN